MLTPAGFFSTVKDCLTVQMAIKQLNPTLPLDTPKGPGQALFVIDYGPEHHLLFTVAIDETREIWTFNNTQVKAQKNVTMGRVEEKKADEALPIGYIGHKCLECKKSMLLPGNIKYDLLKHVHV